MWLTFVSAAVVLGVLIIIHEFGHFIFAKCAGIRVEEFSMGFGPKLLQIKKGDTAYKLCLIPLGGYVKLAGADPGEVKGEPYEFAAKSIMIKIGTYLTGPIFNYLLALVVFIALPLVYGIPSLGTRIIKSASNTCLQYGDEIVSINGKEVKVWGDIINNLSADSLSATDSVNCIVRRTGELQEVKLSKADTLEPFIPAVLGKVVTGGPAYKAGLRELDSVIQVNDAIIPDWDSLVSIVQHHPRQELLIGWIRAGKFMDAKVVPVAEQGIINDTIIEIGMIKVGMRTAKQSIGIAAVKDGALRTTSIIALTGSFFKKLLARKISTKALGGPVAIVRVAGEQARWGLENLIMLIGFLSIQLFIFNLIPFPPLDGGQVLLIIIEKIKKSPISERTLRLVQNIGFAILILFAFYITFNDIAQIVK
ncbi:MAG: RIP metalloprotease RseP [Candidatus Stahlbacteria bacterium]|nr:RIP metalloprotease RseP [Candidatus Stahlbacteria bacterium]